MISRRNTLGAATALAMSPAARRSSAAPAKILRVGVQKGAALLLAERERRGLETLFNPIGIDVTWTEFQFGPPLLEAMRVGSVDIGLVGDTPPIFAQAAKGDLLYVAAVPSGTSAILLPSRSTVETLRDLRGKRVAFARGSSAHNLTIAAVESVGLSFQDIQPIALAPADAAAAFEKGAIDAWTIWDPFYALYETRPGVRVLVESTDIAEQNSFFISARSYVSANSDIVAKFIDDVTRTSTWAAANRTQVAALVAAATAMPIDVQERAMRRYPFQVIPVSERHVLSQQRIADRFHKLGVIPIEINVADQVWHRDS
jgi:NitT/TauT family transport system substrate-binding protein/sulfonate transport system substrate-binding protein